LTRAIKSVLEQTYRDLEVIVVIDGAQPNTRAVLKTFRDARLRVIETSVAGPGPGPARNLGIQHASGSWIGLLDDDDEWMPTKLEKQAAYLHDNPHFSGILTTRVVARTPTRDYIWPERPIRRGEDISTYLIDRPTLLGRPGLVQTSSMLAPKELFRSIPFEDEAHEEWTFIIKAYKLQSAEVHFIWEPLTVYYYDPNAESLSTRCKWELSYDWAIRRRPLLSARAYSAFLLSKVARKAKRQHDIRGLLRIACEGVFHGNIRPRHLVGFLAIVILPSKIGQRMVHKTYDATRPAAAAFTSAVSRQP
jgi:glycosyltransferase involved in cell wall biosynthesis